ncbi:MAG: hypothetical protein Fur0037_19290 [Planctomycetota bacterium]
MLTPFESPAPAVTPPLDPAFRPFALALRSFERECRRAGAVPFRVALERTDGHVFRRDAVLLPPSHPAASANARFAERLVKFLLWSRGGCRALCCGPAELVSALARHYERTAAGRFDAAMAERIFDRPFEVVRASDLPDAEEPSRSLGRHTDGCRIGFDLGGSDRKVASVVDGEVVFSDETAWDPYFQADPAYHYEGVRDSLRRAAEHLPRVDAIGGSAAGVYVENRVKVASLFRGVSPEDFEAHVADMFLRLGGEFGVPLEVVNDGEVTALAGSMALGVDRVLGLSLGTSTAAGYVARGGGITHWLNELAFAPVDLRPDAPLDEWSKDRGCAVQYLSQQAVARLLPVAGIAAEEDEPLPSRLERLQDLARRGDERASKVYETIGVYLGYAIAGFLDFYDAGHVLVLGRVTSGPGGEEILSAARRVLEREFPEFASAVSLVVPDERTKRHGQAIAAASLPALGA